MSTDTTGWRTEAPAKATAGDSLQWIRSSNRYLPSDGWTLYYRLLNVTPADPIDITATSDDNDNHMINVAPAVSAEYPSGTYKLVSWVTDGTDRFMLTPNGQIVIAADPATLETSEDTRSHAEKMLALLQAAGEANASPEILERDVDGVQLKYLKPAERIELEIHYKRITIQERNRRQGRSNYPGSIKLVTREPSA